MVAQEQQKLLCNICGIMVNAGKAKQHVSTSSHESHKSMIERELNMVREKNYQNDTSVVVSWETSSVQPPTISRSSQST